MLFMTAWLFWDSYKIQKSGPVFMRAAGIFLFAIWQVLHSLDVKNDFLLYVGYGLLIIGLAMIIIAFLQTKPLSMNAVLIIPAFTTKIIINTFEITFMKDICPTNKPVMDIISKEIIFSAL